MWHTVVAWMGVTAKTDREQDRNRENTTGTMKHVDTGTDREGGSDELEVAQALRLAGGGQTLPFGSCEQISQTSIFPSVKWGWGCWENLVKCPVRAAHARHVRRTKQIPVEMMERTTINNTHC